MKSIILFFALLFLGCESSSQVSFVPDNPKFHCNRYADINSNFEILSIVNDTEDTRGKYLYENVDQIKSWLSIRWTLPNINYPIKCKIVVAANKDIFKELFNKDSPQYRIVKEVNGQPKEIVIWLAADDQHWNTSTLTKVLTEVNLQELERQNNIKFGFWIHRSMSLLNGDLSTLRQNLGNLNLIFQKDLKVYWTKEILNMTPEILDKHPPESAVWYDSECSAFMLMLYKEHGPRKFNMFLSQCNNPEIALKNVYGYNSYSECDSVFKKYMFNLSCDITGQGQKITPNLYLTFSLR